ncbi:MAG: alpha/beta hydrolase family protein [Isosphaeraceae bacterium]
MIRLTDPASAAVRVFAWGLMAAAMTVPGGGIAVGAETPERGDYLAFVRQQAEILRKCDAPPRSLGEWAARRAEIRRRMDQALGSVPNPSPPLDPARHGTLDRDGYRVEKWTFQTMPGVRMTANLYVPEKPGRHPAILCVHGHFAGAKQDPVVQSRCIAMARLGFVVLAVDAFGAGERGVGKALGEYHGELTAATLLPAGLTLAGLQVYENTRAAAFLAARPEVDPDRIGVTGASGGGNQTMYAISLIDGLKVGVPVCSVGNYRAYLGTACCMCEVVPGALTFTEEWGVLGLSAPKPLMVVNATQDAVQFSVVESNRTLAGLEPLYRLYDRPSNLRHAIFEAGHGYHQPMREAAYGWFAHHLQGRGDGSPIAEPALKPEDPEALRCFPGTSRPDDFVTLPRYAAAVGRKLLESRAIPGDAGAWKAEAERRRAAMTALLGLKEIRGPSTAYESAPGIETIGFEPEAGIRLSARVEPGRGDDSPRAILLDFDGAEHAAAHPIAGEFRREGWSVITLDLRATGRLAPTGDSVGHAPDHSSAEWGLWIGRPLLGQWVVDVRGLLDALNAGSGAANPRRPTVLIGIGPGGLVAMAAAAKDARVDRVAAVGTVASLVSEVPYRGQRVGTIVPGMFRAVGDVGHLAALIAPRRVVIAGGVAGDGRPLDGGSLRAAYGPASRAFGLLGEAGAIQILDKTDPAEVVRALR